MHIMSDFHKVLQRFKIESIYVFKLILSTEIPCIESRWLCMHACTYRRKIRSNYADKKLIKKCIVLNIATIAHCTCLQRQADYCTS